MLGELGHSSWREAGSPVSPQHSQGASPLTTSVTHSSSSLLDRVLVVTPCTDKQTEAMAVRILLMAL